MIMLGMSTHHRANYWEKGPAMVQFKGNALAVLIGSLPVADHDQAIRMVFKYTPEIPLWVQLPAYRQEGMMVQFLPGIPGLKMVKNLCSNYGYRSWSILRYRFESLEHFTTSNNHIFH